MGTSLSSSSWAAFAAASKSASVFRTQALGSKGKLKCLKANVVFDDSQVARRERWDERVLLVLFLLPFLQLHLVRCPVQDCKGECLVKRRFYSRAIFWDCNSHKIANFTLLWDCNSHEILNFMRLWDCNSHLPFSLLFQLLRLSLSLCILRLESLS